ncbi:hypothetical protein N9D38_03270, partial [Rubripirellula sp.]|nr:hypothetical protein [Rubripirellula sp.]
KPLEKTYPITLKKDQFLYHLQGLIKERVEQLKKDHDSAWVEFKDGKTDLAQFCSKLRMTLDEFKKEGIGRKVDTQKVVWSGKPVEEAIHFKDIGVDSLLEERYRGIDTPSAIKDSIQSIVNEEKIESFDISFEDGTKPIFSHSFKESSLGLLEKKVSEK